MRLLLGLLMMLATSVGAWIPAANAQTFLSFTSQSGDYIGQGETLMFTPTDSGFTSMISQDNRELAVSVLPSSSFWDLHLTAPAGTKLLPGVYEGASRWPFQAPPTPGLDFSGDGRGCNTSTGRFVVLEAVYAPFGYVERFHATFEQHCEGGTPALFGEIQIVNPPPPALLTMDLTLDMKGMAQQVSGAATVSGTIQCSQATTVQLSGAIAQRASRVALANGSFSLSIPCSPAPTPWTANVPAQGDVPFNHGPAQVDMTGSATDPNFGVPVTVQSSTLIQLNGERQARKHREHHREHYREHWDREHWGEKR